MSNNKGLFALALPGILLALFISVLSYWLSGLNRFLHPFALALIIGITVGSCFPRKNSLWIGTALCKDILLPVGLFMYATEINFKKLATCCVIGSDILFQCIVYATVTFLIVYFINKALKVGYKTNLLTCVGSAVCGVAAISVGAPMIDAEEEDVTRAIVAIILVGVISFFSLFFLKKFFVTDIYGEKFAVFCGMTLSQDGLVFLAGRNFMERGPDILAANVKYIRSIFMVPLGFIVLFLNQLSRKGMQAEVRLSMIKYGLTMGYILFGAALLFTFTPLGQYSAVLKPWWTVIFGAALAAIGLTCDVRKVLKKQALLNIISAVLGWVLISAIFIAVMRFFPSINQ